MLRRKENCRHCGGSDGELRQETCAALVLRNCSFLLKCHICCAGSFPHLVEAQFLHVLKRKYQPVHLGVDEALRSKWQVNMEKFCRRLRKMLKDSCEMVGVLFRERNHDA